MTPHKIIKSKRRTLSLSINENAELIVRAPNQISNKQIEKFIIEEYSVNDFKVVLEIIFCN